MGIFKTVDGKEIFYRVADSYMDMKIVSDVYTNNKGKTYVIVEGPCHRCGGSGKYGPLVVNNGICFSCNGSGKERKEVRAYTPKEYNKYENARIDAIAKKEKERRLKEEDRIKNEEQYRHKIALERGFGENDCIYVVYGGDTYSIRGEIKKLGGKFNYDFGWYFSAPVDGLPEGFHLCEVPFADVYEYDPLQDVANLKEDVKNIIKKKIFALLPPSNTEYYPAETKERLRNLLVQVSNIKTIGSEMYGFTNIYTFTLDKYVFVWMTSTSHSELKIGSSVFLTGTIKKFDDFEGTHQTYLSRCIIKEI